MIVDIARLFVVMPDPIAYGLSDARWHASSTPHPGHFRNALDRDPRGGKSAADLCAGNPPLQLPAGYPACRKNWW
jgi:hypothetical protein